MASLYLLDTNTVSAVMADHPRVKARLARQPGQVVTCAIVRGEIRYGLDRLPAGKRRANLETKTSTVFAALPVEAVIPAARDIYGTIRWSLERQGYNLSDNDLWIAAAALSLGAILVSNDQAFNHVPGLTVEDWTTS
jgi:tRNA(fMet)-specific endonuclease VapC